MTASFWGVSQVGWQAIAAMVALATVLVTAGAVVIALRQLGIARRTRKEQTRPYIVVDFESSEVSINLMDMVVSNIGSTPAYSVSVRLDPSPSRVNETARFELSKSRILNDEIPMFAPGRKIRLFFDSMPDRYSSGAPMSFNASVRYKDSTGKLYCEMSVVDMDVARGNLQTTIYGLHHVAKSLREIEAVLKKSAIAKGPIHIVSEDHREYVDRKRADHENAMRQHNELMRRLLPSSEQVSPEEPYQ